MAEEPTELPSKEQNLTPTGIPPTDRSLKRRRKELRLLAKYTNELRRDISSLHRNVDKVVLRDSLVSNNPSPANVIRWETNPLKVQWDLSPQSRDRRFQELEVLLPGLQSLLLERQSLHPNDDKVREAYNFYGKSSVSFNVSNFKQEEISWKSETPRKSPFKRPADDNKFDPNLMRSGSISSFQASKISLEQVVWEVSLFRLRGTLSMLISLLSDLLNGKGASVLELTQRRCRRDALETKWLLVALSISCWADAPEAAVDAARISVSINRSVSVIGDSAMYFARMPSRKRLNELDKEALIKIIYYLTKQLMKLSSKYDPIQEIDAGYSAKDLADTLIISKTGLNKRVKKLVRDGWLLEPLGGKWFFSATEVEIIRRNPGCCGPFQNLAE